MPPPAPVAELPLRVEVVTVSVPRVADAAADQSAALPLRVEAVTVSVPLLRCRRRRSDAAAGVAELPLRVEAVTVSVPVLKMPPPEPPAKRRPSCR